MVTGVRGVSIGTPLPAAVHIPQEEPQEEGDGVLQCMSLSQVPPRATQLHRPACHVHPCKYVLYITSGMSYTLVSLYVIFQLL